MLIDVEVERARTPGVREAHHLNAAGAALPSARTLAATLEHLHLESRMGGYEASNAARPRLDAVYTLAAGLLGAHPDEIALTESATTSTSANPALGGKTVTGSDPFTVGVESGSMINVLPPVRRWRSARDERAWLRGPSVDRSPCRRLESGTGRRA